MAHINIKNFKCDATFIKSDIAKKYNRGILLVNFNVPEDLWLEPEETGAASNITKVARAIYAFLVDTVSIEILPKGEERAFFSISSTYTLEHVSSGESRLWTGSFNPRFSGDADNFVPIATRAAFVRYLVDNCKTDALTKKAGDLVAKLSDSDTDWTLGEIKSIIVSVQALVKSTNSFVVINQLQGSQKTFILGL